MKKYKTVLIDLDDTLFDFGQDQKVAFKEAMRQIGQDCTEEMYEIGRASCRERVCLYV